jgi:hypothetical protein
MPFLSTDAWISRLTGKTPSEMAEEIIADSVFWKDRIADLVPAIEAIQCMAREEGAIDEARAEAHARDVGA